MNIEDKLITVIALTYRDKKPALKISYGDRQVIPVNHEQLCKALEEIKTFYYKFSSECNECSDWKERKHFFSDTEQPKELQLNLGFEART